ncbi:ion transporter [Streptomyces sp. NPDC051784]|uniref:ion transporter n=1 Tax=Streptomyces sp. NPDC051784 TaxID=3155805 RepID=UPI00342FEEED
MAARGRAVTEARWFAVTVFVLILTNAAILGIETYSGVIDRFDEELKLVEHAFLAVFTVEILLRVAAHLDRPSAFWRDPWNLFDLAVVVCALLPVVREDATVLRLLLLARVLRYFDRVARPEQLVTAALAAMRVLTDRCLPQDVQAEAYDWPVAFSRRRVWHVGRPRTRSIGPCDC